MTKLNLTETELAQRWGISPKTLQRWRSENRGPSYLKLSKRVTYPVEDTHHRTGVLRNCCQDDKCPDLECQRAVER